MVGIEWKCLAQVLPMGHVSITNTKAQPSSKAGDTLEIIRKMSRMSLLVVPGVPNIGLPPLADIKLLLITRAIDLLIYDNCMLSLNWHTRIIPRDFC